MHVEWVVNPRNPSFRRLNKKGSYTHNPVFLSEAEGSFGWVSALEDWEQY